MIFLPLSISSRSGEPEVRGDEDLVEKIYAPFDSLSTDPTDYTWPTDASRLMTSGFADFRKTHFHGGIDISTRGMKGFKVFAARDGYVERIRVSPYGYGKMLYVRHADGFYTTYAHLQRFNDILEEFVRSVQHARRSYPVDQRLGPERFPVTKGELIAYTGDTGIGPAHLHFEVRDPDLNPVNPLLFPDVAETIQDQIAPIFERMAFTPLTHESMVQYDFQPWVDEVRQVKPGDYLLPRVMHLKGLIGLSVKAFDRVNGSWHRHGVHSLELYVDSLLLFSTQLNRVPDAYTKQVSLHYDWSLWHEGKGRFQKLYVDMGNRLPFYDRGPEGAGVLNTELFGQGMHSLWIFAKDLKGNRSQLRASFVVSHPPEFDLRAGDRSLIVIPGEETSLHALTVSTKRVGSRKWDVRKILLSRLVPTDEGFALPIDGKQQNVVRVVAETEDGSRSHPRFYFASPARSSNTSLSINKEFYRDYLYVAVTSHLPFTLRPTVWVSTGDRKHLMDLNSIDLNKYVGTVPLAIFGQGQARIEANADVNGIDVSAYDEFSIVPISPEIGGTVVAGDGEFTLTFPPRGTYQPLYCRVEKTDHGYSVHPKDVVLNRGAIVEYRPSSAGVPGKTALYYNGDGSWDLMSTSHGDNPQVFSGRVTRFLGDFGTFTDLNGPWISDIRIQSSRQRLSFRFRLYDNLAGVDADSLRVSLNDQFLITEYDPYNRRVTFDERVSLEPGLYFLSVDAHDKVGNRSTAQKTFRVY
jgi:hypothetical protein